MNARTPPSGSGKVIITGSTLPGCFFNSAVPRLSKLKFTIRNSLGNFVEGIFWFVSARGPADASCQKISACADTEIDVARTSFNHKRTQGIVLSLSNLNMSHLQKRQQPKTSIFSHSPSVYCGTTLLFDLAFISVSQKKCSAETDCGLSLAGENIIFLIYVHYFAQPARRSVELLQSAEVQPQLLTLLFAAIQTKTR